jgi:hypothetical protein
LNIGSNIDIRVTAANDEWTTEYFVDELFLFLASKKDIRWELG